MALGSGKGCHAPIKRGEICDRAVKVLTEKFYCSIEVFASFIAKILLDPLPIRLKTSKKCLA